MLFLDLNISSDEKLVRRSDRENIFHYFVRPPVFTLLQSGSSRSSFLAGYLLVEHQMISACTLFVELRMTKEELAVAQTV